MSILGVSMKCIFGEGQAVLFMGAFMCFSLIACSGNDSSAVLNTTKENVALADDLEKCDTDVTNQKVFVEEDSTYFRCDGNNWVEVVDDNDEDSVSVSAPESSSESSSSSDGVAPISAPESSSESSSSSDGVALSSAPESSSESGSSSDGVALSSAPESSSESGSSSDGVALSSAPESSSESSSSRDGVALSSAPESSSSEKAAWAYLNPNVSYGLMQDMRDKQYYKTVKIGDQVWMAENLNYNSGDISSDNSWSGCYGNSADSCAKYGRLYSWDVAMNKASCAYGLSCTPSGTVRGICPEGWHLPSLNEIITLVNPFASSIEEYSDEGTGRYYDAGYPLKSQMGWKKGSFGYSESSNETGFTALPGGGFNGAREYAYVGEFAYFWSASEKEQNSAYDLEFDNDFETAYVSALTKSHIASVRCIQNTK